MQMRECGKRTYILHYEPSERMCDEDYRSFPLVGDGLEQVNNVKRTRAYFVRLLATQL